MLVIEIPDDVVTTALGAIERRPFTTREFVDALASTAPAVWAEIVAEYGAGGRGAGRHFSSYSFMSQKLNRRALAGELTKLDYVAAPTGWGSPRIREWTDAGDKDLAPVVYDDEPDEDVDLIEGHVLTIHVNKYERSIEARRRCIEHHGVRCRACDLDFGKHYGPDGAGFIHVHHRVPISSIGKEYRVDPVKDLVPVCPNCHAMLHIGRPLDDPLPVDELRQRLRIE